jgi:hypothetical protein
VGENSRPIASAATMSLSDTVRPSALASRSWGTGWTLLTGRCRRSGKGQNAFVKRPQVIGERVMSTGALTPPREAERCLLLVYCCDIVWAQPRRCRVRPGACRRLGLAAR